MWKISLKWCGVLLIAILLSVAGSTDAATITVKQLGGGNYTKINDAIFYAQPNDIINVFQGRYEEAVVINKNLSLIGSGPQYTTIYSVDNGITINNNMEATIIGFTITSNKDGVFLNSGSVANIRNNIIVGNGKNGIYLEVFDSNATVINNTLCNNAGSGVKLSTVNTVYAYIYNNIICNNGAYGVSLASSNNQALSYNNIFGNISGNYLSSSAGLGDISQAPSFIDSSSGNFILLSTSTSKNAGRPGSADADPDGSRNDMGAYGGPDAASFWPYPQGTPIITNLTATPTAVQRGGIITIKATGTVQ